jgi:hypothetical protein
MVTLLKQKISAMFETMSAKVKARLRRKHPKALKYLSKTYFTDKAIKKWAQCYWPKWVKEFTNNKVEHFHLELKEFRFLRRQNVRVEHLVEALLEMEQKYFAILQRESYGLAKCSNGSWRDYAPVDYDAQPVDVPDWTQPETNEETILHKTKEKLSAKLLSVKKLHDDLDSTMLPQMLELLKALKGWEDLCNARLRTQEPQRNVGFKAQITVHTNQNFIAQARGFVKKKDRKRQRRSDGAGDARNNMPTHAQQTSIELALMQAASDRMELWNGYGQPSLPQPALEIASSATRSATASTTNASSQLDVR